MELQAFGSPISTLAGLVHGVNEKRRFFFPRHLYGGREPGACGCGQGCERLEIQSSHLSCRGTESHSNDFFFFFPHLQMSR